MLQFCDHKRFFCPRLNLRFLGELGQTYLLGVCMSLADWILFFSRTVTNPLAQVVDPTAVKYSLRSYRTVILQRASPSGDAVNATTCAQSRPTDFPSNARYACGGHWPEQALALHPSGLKKARPIQARSAS